MNTQSPDILIFRTSVQRKQDLFRMAGLLDKHPCIRRWTVDMEDWEKVLRIESAGISAAEISDSLRAVNIMAVALL